MPRAKVAKALTPVQAAKLQADKCLAIGSTADQFTIKLKKFPIASGTVQRMDEIKKEMNDYYEKFDLMTTGTKLDMSEVDALLHELNTRKDQDAKDLAFARTTYGNLTRVPGEKKAQTCAGKKKRKTA